MTRNANRPPRRKWRALSQNLAVTAVMAERFLRLSDDQRREALERPGADRLRPYAGFHLASTIRQARDLVEMLEAAETAWKAVGRQDGGDRAGG